VRVRDAELVEVVDVCEAEDYGGEEDDGGGRGAGEEEEGDGGGAEEDFFGDRALEEEVRVIGAERRVVERTATRFRQPVQLLSMSASRRRIQSLHRPSTIPASKRGPTKRVAVSRRQLMVSPRPTGTYPRWCRAFHERERLESSAAAAMTRKDVVLHARHETVTDRMRARMTEGASRERVGEGRVVGER
jgi:hypothetical protein